MKDVIDCLKICVIENLDYLDYCICHIMPAVVK